MMLSRGKCGFEKDLHNVPIDPECSFKFLSFHGMFLALSLSEKEGSFRTTKDPCAFQAEGFSPNINPVASLGLLHLYMVLFASGRVPKASLGALYLFL